MARRHSRKKGMHGSKKPVKGKRTWMKYSAKEVEQLIVKLAKAGKQPSQIGMVLRDSYGVPDVKFITGKRIEEIIKENMRIEIPEDLNYLMKKQSKILGHVGKNKHDMPSKLGLNLTEGKILGLVRYYKRIGKLPKDWNYSVEQSRLSS